VLEREPVVDARDAESLCEPARARAEEPCLLDGTSPPHRLEAVRRLERAQQDRRAGPFRFADDVRTPVNAVRAVHVQTARRAEHDDVPAPWPAVRVARGVVLAVRLDLHDHAAHAVDQERPADQRRCDVVDTLPEKVAGSVVIRNTSPAQLVA